MSNSRATNTRQQLSARRRKARHYALQALYQWQMAGQNLADIEAQFRADYDMSHVDIEFFSELLHEVPRRLGELQQYFTPFLDRELDDLDPVELALLRMGSYELLCRLDVPYKVAINEAVGLARRFGATDSHRYINGVLDKVAEGVRELEINAERGR